MTEADLLKAIVDRCRDVIEEAETGSGDLSRKVGGLQCMLRVATTFGLIDVEKVQQGVLECALRGSMAHSRHGYSGHGYRDSRPDQPAKAVAV
jgi:hypothetical protein